MAFIEQTKTQYGWAIDTNMTLHKAAGFEKTPHAMLVNPAGEIVWAGHSDGLNKKLIKEHLDGASKTLTYGWGKAFEDVAEAANMREFARAFKELDSLTKSGEENVDKVRTAVTARLDQAIGNLTSSLEKGDALGATDLAKALDGNLKGLEQAVVVSDALGKLKSDKALKATLSGQKKLMKLLDAKYKKKRSVEGAIRKAEAIAESQPGTYLETHAAQIIKELRAKAANLR